VCRQRLASLVDKGEHLLCMGEAKTPAPTGSQDQDLDLGRWQTRGKSLRFGGVIGGAGKLDNGMTAEMIIAPAPDFHPAALFTPTPSRKTRTGFLHPVCGDIQVGNFLLRERVF
jgi:hypothetical protein